MEGLVTLTLVTLTLDSCAANKLCDVACRLYATQQYVKSRAYSAIYGLDFARAALWGLTLCT